MDKKLLLDEVTECVRILCGKEYEITIQNMEKENGTGYTGIIIRKPGESMAPVMDCDRYVKKYGNSLSAKEIADRIVFDRFIYSSPVPIELLDFMDYEKVKGNIIFRLVNYERNQEMLPQIPYERICDLAVIFSILIDSGKVQETSITISNSLQEIWGISLKELGKQALENCERLLPPCFVTREELISGMGMPDKEPSPKSPLEQEDISLYCLTNRSGIKGASAILYPGILKKAADLLGSDLVVLPSSRHEVLLCPLGEIDLKAMQMIVREINRELVAEEDQLSDHVYVFRRSTEKLELGAA